MKSLHFRASLPLAAIVLMTATSAFAVSVNLVGTFGSKALVSIDGGTPRKMAPGDKTADGVELISVSSDGATFNIDGERRTLKMGQHYAAASSGNPTVILAADPQGHFITQGSINGSSARFMVDTGASMISMSAADAQRMSIDYRKGQVGAVSTANGVIPAYKVTLDTVRIGAITVSQVDALVTEVHMPFILLGMSFLNRMEMKRSGEQMTLIKRY